MLFREARSTVLPARVTAEADRPEVSSPVERSRRPPLTSARSSCDRVLERAALCDGLNPDVGWRSVRRTIRHSTDLLSFVPSCGRHRHRLVYDQERRRLASVASVPDCRGTKSGGRKPRFPIRSFIHASAGRQPYLPAESHATGNGHARDLACREYRWNLVGARATVHARCGIARCSIWIRPSGADRQRRRKFLDHGARRHGSPDRVHGLSTPAENPTVPPVENPTDRRGDEPQAVATS
jgi:hypothetical protein